jgi:hypothetical protein
VNAKLLIDAIVRQTTVLIAQLSTAAGVRAPLAQLADQVFLSLAREIEAQGVGRKVVADMFGMALRGYQKKVQRLAESNSQQNKTLFEAVLEYLERNPGSLRSAVLQRFRHDGERETIAVLTDLVNSGLVYNTGMGPGTLYGVTSEAERQRLTRESDLHSLAGMAWGLVYQSPGITRDDLVHLLQTEEARVDEALALLLGEGRVSQGSDGKLRAPGFQVARDSTHGWESAVFDHFQAVATAIANKLKHLSRDGDARDWIGGTTLRFELSPNHPHRAQTLALLGRIRTELDAFWNHVSDYNDAHPVAEDERFNVVFYFGQNVDNVELAEQSP